jgi:hypothetical protein
MGGRVKERDARMSRGQPPKYETHIEPYLDDIRDMALTMTEEQIAKTLNVSYTTFRKYKAEKPALFDALKKGRRELIKSLHSDLIRRAHGFTYEETKTIRENGKPVRIETYVRLCPPDVAAINLALKNFDREAWANDPQMLDLRRKEVELQERRLENSEW